MFQNLLGCVSVRNLTEISTGLLKPVSQCGSNRSLHLNYERQLHACSLLAHWGLLLLKTFYFITFIYFVCAHMCDCGDV